MQSPAQMKGKPLSTCLLIGELFLAREMKRFEYREESAFRYSILYKPLAHLYVRIVFQQARAFQQMSYYVPLTISYLIVGITISYLIPRTGSTIVTETRDVISPSLTVSLSLSLPPRPELVVSLIHQQCEK